MKPLPHRYVVDATANSAGPVKLSSTGLVTLDSDPPAEFGGSGRAWSPETLLVAAVADCFVLTFRAVARAAALEWHTLSCGAEGTLDRETNSTCFTQFRLRAVLIVAEGTDETEARQLLEKSERNCLITRSLTASVHLDVVIRGC